VFFPDKLKKAQVTPLYKKNDPLLKTNYRPVSVLCIFSKIFKKMLEQQLSDFFENIFNPYLCAFRRGHWMSDSPAQVIRGLVECP
jgi:retron-type reverse transcriptase